MVQIRLSFILPCYNVSSYIGACLDSLLVQDIPHEEYEIICVNDCSTDKTTKIIESYQSQYANIRLINHTTNKTAGGARNTGIANAKGKYIWFIDPDDFIKPNILKHLIDLCEKEKLDELLFNYDAINEKMESINTKKIFVDTKTLTGLQFLQNYFHNKLDNLSIVWQQIFRLDFIKENSLYFPEIRVSEDAPFAWRALLNAKRLISITDAPYVYRQNNNSITSGHRKYIKGEIVFSKTILFSYELIQIQNEFKQHPVIVNEINAIIRWAANNFISELMSANKMEKEIFRNACLENKNKIIAIKHFLSRKSFLIISSSYLGRIAFHFFIKIQRIKK